MKIKQFDKATLKAVRADINAVLTKYGVSSGMDFELGSIRFTSASFELKVSAKIKGAVTLDDQIMQSRATALGLKMTGLEGRTLVKYNTRAKAYPFIYSQNGKMFKCSTEQAKRYFA